MEPPLAGKARRVQHLAGLVVPDLKLAVHEHLVHLPDGGVVGLVLKAGNAHNHALLKSAHTPGALVPELPAEQRDVSVLAVFGHLLAGSGAGRWAGCGRIAPVGSLWPPTSSPIGNPSP